LDTRYFALKYAKALKKSQGGEVEAALKKVLNSLSEEDLKGLRVYLNPNGPAVWIDQMDWHNGKGGKEVIAAAKKALGVREVVEHKEIAPGTKAVAVFNEGPRPKGEGGVELT
jgi:hypothetical protein